MHVNVNVIVFTVPVNVKSMMTPEITKAFFLSISKKCYKKFVFQTMKETFRNIFIYKSENKKEYNRHLLNKKH